MKVSCLDMFLKVLIPSLIILGHTMLYLSVHITGLGMALSSIVGKRYIDSEAFNIKKG